ncbi:MAG: LD-carboxypeptidase [Taibaiella sp.]|jgi:muramoyltetrapeptide carboxypeptidase
MNNIIIIPPYLKKGDTVGITCPAGYLPAERTVFAKRTLEAWGYNVIVGSTVGSGHYYFSDTDERRLFDLQALLDNKDVKAILMGRGGYGLSRIIDKIDFTQFQLYPKWICGFSDISVLHSHIQAQFGIVTLHSPMCGAFTQEHEIHPHILSLQQIWTGEQVHYPLHPHEYNRLGKAEGILVGGNLAILAHLSGSSSQMDTAGKILFIEDIGEYLYNIDRMLLNLKRAGMLKDLKALICGGFTDMKDTDRPFGQNIYEIIREKVNEYHYPVCFDFPAGHIDVNYTLALGQEHELSISDQEITLKLLPISQEA